tara:strand:+ start:516 stop:707 length:192 start_codon:yes stop_codon:yes gene_type:complete
MSEESNIESIDFKPRKSRDPELQEAYDEYFAKGGKVTVCVANARTEGAVTNPWQRSKKKKEEK